METIKKNLVAVIVFLFPLFFLPLTQEYYLTNKFYLLGAGIILLMILGTINFIITKKIEFKKTLFDGPLMFYIIAYAISLILMSNNKYQALLNPTTGLGIMVLMTFFYFFVTQISNQAKEGVRNLLDNTLTLSASVLSFIAIIFFFNPFQKVQFPLNLQFLSNPLFTPIGITLDLALFLGFFLAIMIVKALVQKRENKNNMLMMYVPLVLITIAFVMSIYTLIKPMPTSTSQDASKVSIISTLPPYSTSWYTAIETLKKPLTALFGVGPDNYGTAFTQSKTAEYNNSANWQNNYDQSASFFLQLLTEVGVLGLMGFILLFAYAFKSLKHVTSINARRIYAVGLGYLIIAMLFFPPSLPILFLFFILLIHLSLSIRKSQDDNTADANSSMDLSNLIPIYGIIILISLLFILSSLYLLGRSYVAEYYFKNSINSFAQNNAQQTYLSEQKAIMTNPYIEKYRINFSQLNLLLANNIATNKKDKLTDQDKQNINQAIQAAIEEAKAAVSLNPSKSSNWENLAIIYRNILNVAQGADSWTVSAYQRAIIIDPSNPTLRLNLGGVFYTLKNYTDAAKLFEQSVGLKPDWANSHYNLAWSYYQSKNYQGAVQEMQNVIVLLKTNSSDLKQAQKDLEEFKKNLPKDTTETVPTKSDSAQKELTIPTPPQTISPKIELPKDASPEAQ